MEPASTSYFNSIQADIVYDRNNTAYYFNGASTNSTRFEGVSNRTKAHMAISGQTRSSAEYYMARPRITSDSNYWTGAMGWGRQDMNTVGNWGSGFMILGQIQVTSLQVHHTGLVFNHTTTQMVQLDMVGKWLVDN